MSKGTKNQFYKYSLRTAVSQSFWCSSVILMRLQEPDDALTLENLWMHFRATFDAGVASGDRKIIKVGVVNEQPGLPYFDPTASAYPSFGTITWDRYLDLDITADANRVVDFKLDLSTLIDKENPGSNLVYVQAAANYNNQGNIGIWKQDGIYTTREIR